MLKIGELQYKQNEELETARVEAELYQNNIKIYTLFVETDIEYGQYLVTDRADAFLVGVLMYAMVNGEDICCENVVNAELMYMLENQLLYTLSKYEQRFHPVRIYAEPTDKQLCNGGGVGTGISLGTDSFFAIQTAYNHSSESMRLTHLVTFNEGVFGGWYQKNNWDYCARKLYEREKAVANEMGLPLVHIRTNLSGLVKMRGDYFGTYMAAMLIMSLGKLFKTYYFSSVGLDFSYFNVKNTFETDCAMYDLLSINCLNVNNSVQFISAGGERSRLEKIKKLAKFDLAKQYLQSCLTQHYNCMLCAKCKRNLVTMDALGVLDEFQSVYDINYYREHRDDYIEWLCQTMKKGGHGADLIHEAYLLLKEREPEYLSKFEKTEEQYIMERNEFKRQRDIYRDYTRLFRKLLLKENWKNELIKWLQKEKIRDVILYGNGAFTQTLIQTKAELGINITYIIEDIKKGEKRRIPRLPESTIKYPECDAIIICNIENSEFIKKKLTQFVDSAIYTIEEIFV